MARSDLKQIKGPSTAGDVQCSSAGALSVRKHNINASANPTVNDDSSAGYEVGSLWINTTADTIFFCLDASAGAAVWISGGDVSGPSSSIDKGMVTFNGTTGILLQDSGKRNYGGAATNPSSPSPADGDIYYNTSAELWMKYDATRAKWLSIESVVFQVGRNGNTAAGVYYQGLGGQTLSATEGYIAPLAGTVVAMGYTRTDTDAATFEVTAAGASISTLASTALKGSTAASNGNFSAADVLAMRNQSGGNTTTDVQAWFKVRWRT